MKQALPGSNGSGPRAWTLVTIVVGAAACCLLPHPPNMTPVGGMALFAGAHFARRAPALALPLAAMLAKDVALEVAGGTGFHAMQPAVYLSVAAAVLLGRRITARTGALGIAAVAVGASTLFFLVTNTAVWAVAGLYPADVSGLLACYVAALPFFGNTLVGDLVTTAVLFGGFSLAGRRWPALAGRAHLASRPG